MDVSKVKVLARRANGLLIVVPIIMLFCGFASAYSILVVMGKIVPDRTLLLVLFMLAIFGPRHRWRYVNDYYNEHTLAFYCAFSYSFELLFGFWLFVRRLSVPKVIIEYDDYGLYIYKKGMPVRLLRYKELWSTYVQEELFDMYEDFDASVSISVKKSFFSETGAIRIETPQDFIVLSGVYHVKEVEKEIKRMVLKNRQEFIKELEENIEYNKRQRELEELAKHNPDT